MSKTFVIAEVGINHNGKMDNVIKLIDAASEAGCDAVKFQKRSIERVYTKEELDKPRESPWGKTNREQKQGLELSQADFETIDLYCKEKGIEWFASLWDLESVKFLSQFNIKYNKIASAMITHIDLLMAVAEQGRFTFIATGMSTLDEIEQAVRIFRNFKCPFQLLHCNSQYPMPDSEANLLCIKTLQEKFDCQVGYSGHEVGIITSVAAVVLGANVIERHITLDRAMYGSDQSASLEPQGFKKMIEYIRVVETVLGDGEKRITKGEEAIKAKLRRTNDY